MDLSKYTIAQLNATYAVTNRAVLTGESDDVALRDALAKEIEQRVDEAHAYLHAADSPAA